jgi:hypothetical protein
MTDPDPVVTSSATATDDDGRTWYARLVGGGLLLIPLLLLYLLIAIWPRPQSSITCDWQAQKDARKEVPAPDDAEPEASSTPAVAAVGDETPSSEIAQPTASPSDADAKEESADDTTQAAAAENREDWAEQWAPCASIRPFIGEFRLLADIRLLILVLLAGALGAYVHAAQSYTSYIGNQKFKKQWTWWYLLRIPVGAALALFIYFTARGGLLTGTTPANKTDDLNLFGIMAFAALSGLFSKQVIDKLAEVFSNFFRSEEDAKRRDKYDEDKGGNPPPGGGGGTGGTGGAGTGSSGTTTGAAGSVVP